MWACPVSERATVGKPILRVQIHANAHPVSFEAGLDPLSHDTERDRRDRLLDIRVLADGPGAGRLEQVVEPVESADGDVRVVRCARIGGDVGRGRGRKLSGGSAHPPIVIAQDGHTVAGQVIGEYGKGACGRAVSDRDPADPSR